MECAEGWETKGDGLTVLHKEGSKGCLFGSSPWPPMASLSPEDGRTAASRAGGSVVMSCSVT